MLGAKFLDWLWVPLVALHLGFFLDAGLNTTSFAAALTILGICQNTASATLALSLTVLWLVTAVTLCFPSFRRLGYGVAILSQSLAAHVAWTRINKAPIRWDCFTEYLQLPPVAALGLSLLVTTVAVVGFNRAPNQSDTAKAAIAASATWAVALSVLGLAFLVPRVQRRASLWLNAEHGFLTTPRFIELQKTAGGGVVPKLIVFSDYQCPGCREQDAELKQAMQAKVISERSVRFANLPLARIHPFALRAAVLAESVPAANFWPLHNQLMEAELTADWLDQVQAEALAGGPEALRVGRERVERDALVANRLGLIQTPTVFVVTHQYAVQLPSMRDAIHWMSAP